MPVDQNKSELRRIDIKKGARTVSKIIRSANKDRRVNIVQDYLGQEGKVKDKHKDITNQLHP